MKVTYVTDEDGSVKQIPLEQYDRAVQRGERAATPSEVAAYKQSAEAEAHPIQAGAEGVIRGGVNALTAIPRAATALAQTAGITDTDPLAGATGENMMRALQKHAIRSVYEEHGIPIDDADLEAKVAKLQAQMGARANTTAGQVGGAVGGILGSAPSLALGEAAQGAVGATTAAGRIGAGALGGAAMMAPQAVADEAQQAHDEGRALTGEQAMAAVMHGVLSGAAVGGGMAGLGELVGGVVGRARSRVLDTTGEDVTPESAETVKKPPGPLAKLMGIASGKDPEAIADMLDTSPAGKETRRLAVFDGDETRASAERALRSHVNSIEEATRNLTPEWRELKAENVARSVATEPEAVAQQQALAGDWLASAREKVDEMQSQADVYTDRGAVKRLSNAVSRAEREVGSAVEEGDSARMFTALDDLKKRIGDKSVTRAGQMLTTGGGSDTAQAARGLYDDLRGVLEHDAWGQAGQMQKQVNQAFTDWMGTKKLFDQRFMTETGKEGWERTYGADPGKIAGFVRGLTDPAKDLDHSIIEQHLASTENLAQALASAGGLTEAKQAELASIQGAVKGFSDELGTAGKAIGAVNKLDMLKGGGQHGIGLGSLIGHAFGGFGGGAIGGALGALTNPAAMVERLALAERLAGSTESTGKAALDGLFDGIGQVAKRAQGPLEQIGKLSSLELFQAHHDTPGMAYQDRVEDLLHAQASLPERVTQALGARGIQDPALALAAYASANRAIEYLKAQMPSGLIDTATLTPNAQRIQPSREEVMGFADIWSAVMRPRDVIAGIPEGRVSGNQMDAIKNVYPRVYTWLQKEAFNRVSDADQAGHEIPLRQRDILDSLFDLGGAAGRSYSIDFAARVGPQMGDNAAKNKNKPSNMPGPSRLGGKRMGSLTSSMIGS